MEGVIIGKWKGDEKGDPTIEIYKSLDNRIPTWMVEELKKTKHFQTIGSINKYYFRDPLTLDG